MLELRAWGAELPRGASIRLDIPHSGFQAWAADFLQPHPLVSPDPLAGAVNPHVVYGAHADYSLALTAGLNRSFAKARYRVPAAGDVIEPPQHSNGQFVLRRTR
jgi:hypothetical protein